MALYLGWYHPGATSLGQRAVELVYFSGLAVIGWGSLIVCTYALFHALRPLRPKPWLLWLGGVVLTLVVLSYPKMVFVRLSDLFLASPYAGTRSPYLSWAHLMQAAANAPPGIIAWMAVNFFYDRVLRMPRFVYPPAVESEPLLALAAPSPEPQVPAFLQELDTELRADEVLALEACDHYIRIHTTGRTPILHCRFGDAVEQMSRQPGAQVHRSYWVAAGAMKTLEKHKYGYQLALTNGALVPVSRTHLKDVKHLLAGRFPPS